jgi:predicted RNA-binding Zn-ribbon protein involved in translation (DUF1610 family)
MSKNRAERHATPKLHHDDPPCSEPLDDNGRCAACKLHPDMQSTGLHLYCPDCHVHLNGTVCPTCRQAFLNPFAP